MWTVIGLVLMCIIVTLLIVRVSELNSIVATLDEKLSDCATFEYVERYIQSPLELVDSYNASVNQVKMQNAKNSTV